MSQLDLAMRAGFSTRHVSFIETGRTQPSRQALLVLAETLDVPLRERNRLLEAGGFAHVYRQTPLAAGEMEQVRGVLQFILDRHEPYGAAVLDRYSNVLMANDGASRLLGALVDPTLLTGTANLLRMVFHPLGVRRFIVNWEDVARHLLGRAERELGPYPQDDSRRRAARGIARLRRAVRARAAGGAAPPGRSTPARAHQAPGRSAADLQHHHDARDAAGVTLQELKDRDVLSSRRGDGKPRAQHGRRQVGRIGQAGGIPMVMIRFAPRWRVQIEHKGLPQAKGLE